MKSTFHRALAAVLFLVPLVPVRTLAAVTVYAAEVPTASVATASGSVAESNAPAANVTGTNIVLSGTTSVRIDKSGIHIGGDHPVDINVPSIANHHKERGLDVVGLVAVVFGCAIPIAIVVTVGYFRHRRFRMQHETIRAMVEKGMPIPPELLTKVQQADAPQDRPYRARNDLRGGLILVGVGAGLLMLAGKVGWILVFIGTARLVFWLMEDRNLTRP